jgi:hypothetical protein
MKSKRDLALRQIELQEKMQGLGLNIVSCGNCGEILIHESGDKKIDCFCDAEMDLCDCPDFWYRGMENNPNYQDKKIDL